MTTTGKRAAGEAAASLVRPGMRLGLGTGSTVAYFLEAIAGLDRMVAGVPTSSATRARCEELRIEVLDPARTDRLDLGVDGADELDADLTLTKGGGGALLREKVVASMCDRFVVIATPDKVVERLGDTFALPIEVVPFAVGPVGRAVEALGFEVAERRDGAVSYRTDNGNAVLDARFPGGIEDPAAMDVTLNQLPGVVANGLFVGLTTEALLGDDGGVVTRMTARAEAG